MSASCTTGPEESVRRGDQAAVCAPPHPPGPSSLRIVLWLQFSILPTGFWNTSWVPGPRLPGLRAGTSCSPCPLPSEPASVHHRTQYTQRKLQKSRQPRPSSQYNQKLFGGDMEKFIQVPALPHDAAASRPGTPVSPIANQWSTAPSWMGLCRAFPEGREHPSLVTSMYREPQAGAVGS